MDLFINAASHSVYSPLAPGQIRVLHLESGSKSDKLSGKLVQGHFDDGSVAYDALSYMWGDPSPTDAIWLAGESVPIASNLAAALYHLRYHDKPLRIWIDALCIDQGNDTERAQQVQLMGRLYKCAKTVRIWINVPSLDDECEAVKALQDFYKVGDDDELLLEGMGDDPSFWDPVAPIFENDYWNRAWIQQEVLNSTQISLHCMDVVIPGLSLKLFQAAILVRWHSSVGLDTPIDVLWCDHLALLSASDSPAARSMQQHQERGPIYNLCEILYLDIYTTRPQDRVYALMHLTRDYKEGSIVADYAKSGADALIDAAAYHVRLHRNLWFMSVSYMDDGVEYAKRSGPTEFPTWLPRAWSGDISQRTFGNSYDLVASSITQCLPDSISTATRRVRVRGIRIDEVKVCLTPGLDIDLLTPREFWDSLLGLYLQIFAGPHMENLPHEAYEIFFNSIEMDHREYYKLLQQSFEPTTPQDSDLGLESREFDDTFEEYMVQTAKDALSVFLQLAQNPRHADVCLESGEAIPENIDPDVRAALLLFLSYMDRRVMVLTSSKKLGRVPECAIKAGDEIWIALGCDMPIIVRRQPSGHYWYICSIESPRIQKHEELKSFTSGIQPGDKIGEWTVEEIELE